MPLVASDQIVGTGSIGTFQKFVVTGVFRDLEHMQREPSENDSLQAGGADREVACGF